MVSMRLAAATMVTGAILAAAPVARGQQDTEVARLRNDVTRLQQEVRDLKQLLMQTMQSDQQRFEMLLKLIQSGGGTAALPPGATTARPLPLPGTPAPDAPNPQLTAPPAPTTGTISGRVRAEGDLGEAYVYVDGYKSSPPRNRVLEIRQKDKRFIPSVAVVQVGTRATFPNYDTVIHNVFSSTPDNVFDLGTVKAGDKTAPITLLKPGHVEVFCNIHSKMRLDLLVVQNPYWAKVAPDGSFQISGVPTGTRRLVLWGPNLASSSQRVEVTSHGANVTINAAAAAPRPHLNKQGQPYGSYAE
jgi:plastocyanin